MQPATPYSSLAQQCCNVPSKHIANSVHRTDPMKHFWLTTERVTNSSTLAEATGSNKVLPADEGDGDDEDACGWPCAPHLPQLFLQKPCINGWLHCPNLACATRCMLHCVHPIARSAKNQMSMLGLHPLGKNWHAENPPSYGHLTRSARISQ